SEMSVREVESQLPGTAERDKAETEKSGQRAWKNRIRTASQRKPERTKEVPDTSAGMTDAFRTEIKKEEPEKSPAGAAGSGESAADAGPGNSAADARKEEPGKSPAGAAGSGRSAANTGSGISALERELLGVTGNPVEEEVRTDSSLDLERELLSVRADASQNAGRDVHPNPDAISLEFEKKEKSTSEKSAGADDVISDEDTFYADIAGTKPEKKGPVNEPLKGERYDPMEEELERREKKDRLIRIILFTALMLMAGALLTYVTFIRDSGKKASDSSKVTTSRKAESIESAASETAAAESGTASTSSVPAETVEDISTEDLSAYLSEMPAEGDEIVSTADAVYTYEQMVKDLYFLTTRYPDIITANIAATTLDGRAVYEVLIGNPEGSMHVVVQYGMRGDEYITSLLAMRQLEYYCEERTAGNVYRNHNYKEIFADVCIHVLPMVNPDGVAISQSGMEALRTKAARDSVKACYEYDKAAGLTKQSLESYLLTFGANASGVDISKNFPAGWSKYTGGAVQPSFEGYKGPSAGSEPETQAVMNAVNDQTKGVVIYRATGNVIYWDYGAEGTVYEEAEHLAESLSTRSEYPLTALPKYDAADAGGCADYFIEAGIPAVSVVVGEGTSPVDISAFPDIWAANLNILPMLANLYTNG
ncbi:MAG: hypothetical protein J6D46_00080, partial [Lachnospiraceae bacterium]|nr:hypothetical protein [Lachnospiraceae bacterium]